MGSGAATVVSPGSTSELAKMLSNPITLTCSGTETPLSASAFSTPMPMRSLWQITARSDRPSTTSAAARPPWIVGANGPMRSGANPSERPASAMARQCMLSDQDASRPAT